MELPRHIHDRVERIYAYHGASKLRFGAAKLQHSPKPPVGPLFPEAAKIPLPTTLLDEPLGTLAVLESATEALPDSFMAPPQDLKTLASWLYMADGILSGAKDAEYRTWESQDGIYPTEIYVASIALLDLEPGLYHYDPRAFCLRKLREGPETLSQLKRGRPDLEFLKRAPGTLLVSSSFAKTNCARGYRSALVDCGQLVQNLVTVASGLGIQTVTRLRMTESTMRELIGVGASDDFSQEESVQAMVVWADRTQREAIESHVAAPALRQAERAATVAVERQPVKINAGAVAVASLEFADLALPPISRSSLSPIHRNIRPIPCQSAEAIRKVQHDCVAPGVALREIRPPLTEMTPLADDIPCAHLGPMRQHKEGQPLRNLLLNYKPVQTFAADAIPRDTLRWISHFAFSCGTFFPLFPQGLHTALARPFWIVHNVAGTEPGIWYHRSDVDQWCMLRHGELRFETQFLVGEDPAFGEAAAVCLIVANIPSLLLQGSPDTYRLAHLEAGTAARRLALAAGGYELSAKSSSLFYDDEIRQLLGLQESGWEPLGATAIGKDFGNLG